MLTGALPLSKAATLREVKEGYCVTLTEAVGPQSSLLAWPGRRVSRCRARGSLTGGLCRRVPAMHWGARNRDCSVRCLASGLIAIRQRG